MRGKSIFVTGFALVGALLNIGTSFAVGVHSYDATDIKTYGEDVIQAVRNTFKEELTNTHSAVLHDSTGDKALTVSLRPIYGITNASDIVGIYYYDDNLTLTSAPLDAENEGVVVSEAIVKIVDHKLFDADEEDTSDSNQSSIFVIDSFLDSGDTTREVYSFMDAFRWHNTAFTSENESLSVETKTFKVTIPAHKKWGFYLTNGPNTYYTDEEFNVMSPDYPERRYSQTADITVGGEKHTIFGLEDWLATSNPGTDEQCRALADDTERDPYSVGYNCMDANDIVFVLEDNYVEPEEPAEGSEEKNPETGDISISLLGLGVFAIACFGVIVTKFMNYRS